MKTYEETLKSVLRKKAELENRAAEKKQRISLVAAVAAAVLLITAIPVGAFIISHRADQPVETQNASAEKAKDNVIADDCEIIRNISVKESSPSHTAPTYDGRTVISIDDTFKNELPDGNGYLFRGNARFDHLFDINTDYQADIVFTDGNTEISHITYNNDNTLSDNCSSIDINFDLFIPEGLEYGEIYVYFNILEHGTENKVNYSIDPYGESCVNFYTKYGYAVSSRKYVNYTDKETLSGLFHQGLYDYIYWCVSQLYFWDIDEAYMTSLDHDRQPDNGKKELLTKILTDYKKDNAETYEEIVEDFRNHTPKQYDGSGNIIVNNDYLSEYHDPLGNNNIGSLSNSSTQFKENVSAKNISFIFLKVITKQRII